MEDLFRGFFGLGNNNREFTRRDYVSPDDLLEDRESSTDREDVFGDLSKMMFGFSLHLPQGVFGQFDRIFADMDAVMRETQHSDEQFPALTPGYDSTEKDKEKSARDLMLKVEPEREGSASFSEKWADRYRQNQGSFWSKVWRKDIDSPAIPEDTDLDSTVKSQGLDSILPSWSDSSLDDRGIVKPRRVDPLRSFSSSFSSSTFVFSSADGKFEEKRTTRDADGNVETVVRRSVGDDTVTEWVKKDRGGEVIDSRTETHPAKGRTGGSQKVFGDKLKRPAPAPEGEQRDGMLVPREQLPQLDTDVPRIFRNLFGFDFPGFGGKNT